MAGADDFEKDEAMEWYAFGDVAVTPTRYGTVLISASDIARVAQKNWHVRVGKTLYVRTWIDSRRDSSLRGKFIYLHQFLMGVDEVDFRNGNGLDCRRENLRECDRTENCCNRQVVHAKSGHLGVDYDKARGKWRAQIGYRGKHMMLGRFDSIEEAIAARAKAATELHGEFASKFNFEVPHAH